MPDKLRRRMPEIILNLIIKKLIQIIILELLPNVSSQIVEVD